MKTTKTGQAYTIGKLIELHIIIVIIIIIRNIVELCTQGLSLYCHELLDMH